MGTWDSSAAILVSKLRRPFFTSKQTAKIRDMETRELPAEQRAFVYPQTSIAMRVSSGLALIALICFGMSLFLPAIGEGGYKDGDQIVIAPNVISGLGCALGALIGAWLEPQQIVYVFCNGSFILLTIVLVLSDDRFILGRSLVLLASTVFPLHFILTYSHGLYVGAYLWLLAFVLSTMAHWIRFFYFTNRSVAIKKANLD